MQDNVKRHGSADVLRAKKMLSRLAQRASTVQVAAETGIHQSQVSRLLRGQFQRMSTNVAVLLNYATAPRRVHPAKKAQEAAKASVVRAALRTWDATPAGAQALVRLLRSVQQIRGAGRAK